MKSKMLRGERKAEQEFSGLEITLQATLQPVTPRPEYVRDLGNRLRNTDDSIETTTREVPFSSGLWIAGSLLSGVVLVVLGIRGILVLIGSLGRLRPNPKTGSAQVCPAPIQQAL